MKKQTLFILAALLCSLTDWHGTHTMQKKPDLVKEVIVKNYSSFHLLPEGDGIIKCPLRKKGQIELWGKKKKRPKKFKKEPSERLLTVSLSPQKDKMIVGIAKSYDQEYLTIINIKKFLDNRKPVKYTVKPENRETYIICKNFLWLPDNQHFIAIETGRGIRKITCFRCDNRKNKTVVDHTKLPGITSSNFLTNFSHFWEKYSVPKMFSPNAQYLLIEKTNCKHDHTTFIVNTQTGKEIDYFNDQAIKKIKFITNDSLIYISVKKNHLTIREYVISQATTTTKLTRKITFADDIEDDIINEFYVDICPNIKFLALVLGDTVKIINLSSGKLIYQFAPHSNMINEIKFYKEEKSKKLLFFTHDEEVAKIWQISDALYTDKPKKKYVDLVIKNYE